MDAPSSRIRSLKAKRWKLIVVLTIPTLVLASLPIISAANDRYQYQAVNLPGFLMVAYNLSALCSPLLGAATLWNLRRERLSELGVDEARVVHQLRFLSVAAILAALPLAIGAIFVFFAAGMSR